MRRKNRTGRFESELVPVYYVKSDFSLVEYKPGSVDEWKDKMKFSLGDHAFSIEDSWWSDAKMSDFKPEAKHYCPTVKDGVRVLDISRIEPRIRARGFNRRRLLRILTGFRKGREIPPIEVFEFEATNGYVYRIMDGYHRYHSSIAAGFTHIPAVILEIEKKKKR